MLRAIPYAAFIAAVLFILLAAIAWWGVVLISAARAEDAPPPPTEATAPVTSVPSGPGITQQPAKFYLELDPTDLQQIGQALNELPKRVADPLILKINSQLQNQALIAAPAKEAADKAKKGKK
jgi:hypothetical protein